MSRRLIGRYDNHWSISSRWHPARSDRGQPVLPCRDGVEDVVEGALPAHVHAVLCGASSRLARNHSHSFRRCTTARCATSATKGSSDVANSSTALESSDGPKALGATLKTFRERALRTQEQLAERLDYSHASVASVEQGRRIPTARFVERAEDALEAFGVLRAMARHVGRQRGWRSGSGSGHNWRRRRSSCRRTGAGWCRGCSRPRRTSGW
ncbi:helix-turn-helix domain-containing protein [Streptomyces sp. NPDC051041]|uniref:helix-turn-helix domain-containing protein n=1 Tax=Streptomyces sp. NPDC051041 TaxID=3365640 RepID=UPI0037A8B3AD